MEPGGSPKVSGDKEPAKEQPKEPAPSERQTPPDPQPPSMPTQESSPPPSPKGKMEVATKETPTESKMPESKTETPFGSRDERRVRITRTTLDDGSSWLTRSRLK
jgi:2-oxoglutarate dehydrogenase E2 component (dihydrolipoamide succinyltransferase)